jgi:hypothetical protein
VKCPGSSAAVSTQTGTKAVPSFFQFRSPFFFSSSTNGNRLTASFVLRGSVTGCYNLVLRTAGVEKYQSLNISVSIRSDNTKPPAPALVESLFSDDCVNVLFTFDSETDEGGTTVVTSADGLFNCSMLLLFSKSDEVLCFWKTKSVISTSASSLHALSIGVNDSVTLRGQAVRAACVQAAAVCAAYDFAASSTVRVKSPVSPLPPTASLSSARLIEGCDSLST